jgi:hypothetical protein
MRENIKISAQESLGYCESKHRNPCCNEECSKLVYQKKQAILQWLQDPRAVNEGNLNNARREARRRFSSKEREYLKDN